MLNGKSDLSRLVKGISFSWIRFAITIGIGIIQTPLLFKYLDKTELNFWYIFYSFGAFLQLADFGLIQTISRLISYIDNSEDSKNKNETIVKLSKYSTKQIYYTALFSFASILSLLSITVFVTYIFIYNQGTSSLKIAFLLYVIGVVFNLLSNIPAAMLIGYRDVGSDSVVRSITQVIYFVFLLIALPQYKSIIIVSFGFIVQNSVQFFALCFTFYTKNKSIFTVKINRRELIKLDIAQQIYSQSFPLVVNQVGGWLISQGNIFIASVVVGADKISDYAINQQLFSYVTAIALVINQSIGPFIAKQYIQNKSDRLQLLFYNTMLVCLCLVSIFLISLLSCGNSIIALWVGPSHFLGNLFGVIFSLITFLEVQHSVAGGFVWNTGSWPFNKWTLVAGILTVLLGYTLGNQYGLIGIAIATLVARLVTLNWYVVYYGLNKLNIQPVNYLKSILLPLVVSISVSLFVAWYIKHIIMQYNFGTIMDIIAISGGAISVFLILIYVLFRKSLVTLYETMISARFKPGM